VYRWLEPRRTAKHEAGCDDCWSDDPESLWCGHLPRTALQDIRCHNFHMDRVHFIREYRGETSDVRS